MKDKKLQVFVSSTYSDLKEERQAAVEAILSSGHIPAGMELFSAGDESQLAVIKRWIDESDIYLLILGGRYGSIEPLSGKSYTQLEYEYAVIQRKPLFAVVMNEKALEEKVKREGSHVLERENPKLLQAFRDIVLSNLVRFWDDKKDIKLAIHETISEFSYTKVLVGWIRGDNQVNTGILAEEIARLTKENGELRVKLQDPQGRDTALYSGMTYEQLRDLLKKQTFEDNVYASNLFDLIFYIGAKIESDHRVHLPKSNKGAQKLELFKIIYRTGSDLENASFLFTPDGHNFYLKALLLDSQGQTTQ
ncbi:DUF4062 domain-containing protein [Flavitalea sp. BT771]|uniref:DUF4062 domain-containing protein n=1 Tax=Flavitalea sp. BT771 TaxID=3063329 RepID=UPI0026E41CAC|nr:DUF4062 domain-containing protein [Flavitalea sp. BT771]MDO6433118.1 DUF4062 domain-containing protein [Flavitalea sp. BT771]MDV6221606.1 DUF4062 domain-containing protein [Flavitalea sp. BT771]